MPRPRFLRRAFALPTEHGSWVWWLGPFAIGVAAGGRPGGDLVALFVAALAGFLLHHPAVLAVKAATGRRSRADLAPALAWVAVYAAVAASATPCFVVHGHARVLWLLVPGALVFAVHLTLVARRRERRRMGVEILGAGVLALAAPAAYEVSGGTLDLEALGLWALSWAATAASIANVYLLLEQRGWTTPSPPANRLRAGRATLALHGLALAAAVVAAGIGAAPPLAVAPMAFLAADAVDTTLRPRLGIRPAQAGARQLAVLILFVGGMAAAYAAFPRS